MTLAAGARLGAYEIGSLLGAGGPTFARGWLSRKLRRGLAVAREAGT